MRVAVGIPSYCEADSVAHVVRQVDLGLTALPGVSERVIVNVDGASPDGTAAVFLAAPARAARVALSEGAQPGGKGRNLLRFLRWADEHGFDALVTVDADLRSIEPGWVAALAGPVLAGAADYVTPLYRRSRFDGATTNHLAYPLVYAAAGRDLRQPIAGDFGLSRALARHLLAQPVEPGVLGYGIDLFMTWHALRGGFLVSQAVLGRKLHKPSFAKRPRIFRDVAAAGLALVTRLGVAREAPAVVAGQDAIDDDHEFAQAAEAQSLFAGARARARARREVYRAWADGERAAALDVSLRADVPALGGELWAELLAGAVWAALRSAPAEQHGIVEALEPAYALRTLSLWHDTGTAAASVVEKEVARQAGLFRAALRARLET